MVYVVHDAGSSVTPSVTQRDTERDTRHFHISRGDEWPDRVSDHGNRFPCACASFWRYFQVMGPKSEVSMVGPSERRALLQKTLHKALIVTYGNARCVSRFLLPGRPSL